MNDPKRITERVSPDATMSLEDELVFQMHEKTYDHAMNFAREKDVLDVGCGDGYGTFALSEVARHVIGLDVLEDVVESAGSRYRAPNLEFALFDGQTLPYDDHTFDCVVSFQVIEHVPDPDHFLTEIHRVLRPGGCFMISTPNAAIRLLPWQNPWNRYHITEFTRDELAELTQRRFRDIKFWGLGLVDLYARIERRRTNRNKWILWPFSIKLWPYKMRYRMLNFISYVQGHFYNAPDAVSVPPNVAVISEDNLSTAPSLIVSGRKPASSNF